MESNTVTVQDVHDILNNDIANPNHPQGYVYRTIVVVGRLLGLRPEALLNLAWNMFTEEVDHEGNPCLRYQGRIGSYDGDCKTDKGGLSMANKLPTSKLIFSEELSYNINPYKYIIGHRNNCFRNGNNANFFLAPNKKAGAKRIIKSALIGQRMFSIYWNEILSKANVRGVGTHKNLVLHSLRKTLINNLMRSGFTENKITLRTGDSSMQSLHSNANIMGAVGMMQQKNIPKLLESAGGSSSKRLKITTEEGEIMNAVQFAVGKIKNYGNMAINVNINKKD